MNLLGGCNGADVVCGGNGTLNIEVEVSLCSNRLGMSMSLTAIEASWFLLSLLGLAGAVYIGKSA